MFKKVRVLVMVLVLGLLVSLMGGAEGVMAAEKGKEKNKYPSSSSVEVESNNNRNEANEVQPNEKIVGNLTNYSDEDYYKFTFPSNGLLWVDFLELRLIHEDIISMHTILV